MLTRGERCGKIYKSSDERHEGNGEAETDGGEIFTIHSKTIKKPLIDKVK